MDYRGVLLETVPRGREENRLEQREKRGCNAVASQALAPPTGSSETGVALIVPAESRHGGWAFTPSTDHWMLAASTEGPIPREGLG